MGVAWEKRGNQTIFSLDGKEALLIITPEGMTDSFEKQGEGLLLWRRTAAGPAEAMERFASMCMEAEALFIPEHTMVPAVSYDGNPWGQDHEYKGLQMQDRNSASAEGTAYTFASHRCAVPGATCSWNDLLGVALFGRGVCSGSMQPKENGHMLHRILWPEQEGPQVLYSDAWGEAFYGTMEPAVSFTAWLYIAEGKQAVKGMLQAAWKREYVPKPPVRKTGEVWDLSTEYARLLYTEEKPSVEEEPSVEEKPSVKKEPSVEKDGFRAFSIGFTWNGEEWVKRPDFKYEIGWCGQNASLAVSLLYDYQMNHREESLQYGVSVLDSWVEKARSREGLLLTRYDPEDSLIDACNLGTAGQQFFEAYDQAKRLGLDKKKWLDAAYEICDFAMSRQRLDGGIGMSWNRDGSPHELKGTAGAFLILPLAEAYLRTGEDRYNIAAVRAYSYYYREFANNGYGTSGALDTCCIDKESVIPLLKGGLLMYRATGFDAYLDMAEEAAWYLSTWQWHQTVEYPADTVLGKMGYDTFGGTAVSTSHHHLDPFALCYVPDLLELSALTGREEWKERALAIWRNGVQGISDGTMQVLQAGPRPAGSCDEGILHTRWGNYQAGKNGGWGSIFSVTQWLVAWPCAFRLEVLRKCGNWNLLDGWRA